MKRLLLILILLLPRLAAAQSNSVDDFFSRYAAAEGFTSVQLEQKMMQLMSRQAAERGDKGLAVLLKDIQYIRIIALKESLGAVRSRLASDVGLVWSDIVSLWRWHA